MGRILFTNSFLAGATFASAATGLLRGSSADPAEIATAWLNASDLQNRARDQRVADAVLAATALLRWLEAELQSRPEVRPLFDKRVADDIAIAAPIHDATVA